MNRHTLRCVRLAGAVTAAGVAVSLGAGHAVAALLPPPADAMHHLEAQVRQAVRSAEDSLGLKGIDPADPGTWPVELIATGVGVTALVALMLVASSSESADTGADPAAEGESPDSSSTEGIDLSATEYIVGSSRTGSSQPEVFGSSINGVDLLGSSNFPIPDEALDLDWSGPLPFSDSIVEAEIVDSGRLDDRTSWAAERGYERWRVASPAMGREVELQVLPAKNRATEEAPILILLDGVNAPKDSGWIWYRVKDYLYDENVTLVMPTEARASFYVDWEKDDEALGRMQWETFLARELPRLLAAEESLNHNGRIGIGGLSMGATGAVALANANPDVFDATFGISGCYSTESAVGYQTARLVVETRGGDLENMLGEPGSETRRRYDVVGNPEGLRNQAVYLSASAGEFPENHVAETSSDAFVGMVLEQGSYLCTQDLEDSLRDAGIEENVLVEYDRVGVHNWDTFEPRLAPAWNHIKSALYAG